MPFGICIPRAYPYASLFSEDMFHGLQVERLHEGELQALHHVERALLVLLEVVCLEMSLIDFLRGINLEDANLTRVLAALHRVEADDAWLALDAEAVNFFGNR